MSVHEGREKGLGGCNRGSSLGSSQLEPSPSLEDNPFTPSQPFQASCQARTQNEDCWPESCLTSSLLYPWPPEKGQSRQARHRSQGQVLLQDPPRLIS